MKKLLLLGVLVLLPVLLITFIPKQKAPAPLAAPAPVATPQPELVETKPETPAATIEEPLDGQWESKSRINELLLKSYGGKRTKKFGLPRTLDLTSEAETSAAAPLTQEELREIWKVGDRETEPEKRGAARQKFLTRSAEFLTQNPQNQAIWILRAMAAIEMNEREVGTGAVRRLTAFGLTKSENPLIKQIYTHFRRMGWDRALVEAATAPKESVAVEQQPPAEKIEPTFGELWRRAEVAAASAAFEVRYKENPFHPKDGNIVSPAWPDYLSYFTAGLKGEERPEVSTSSPSDDMIIQLVAAQEQSWAEAWDDGAKYRASRKPKSWTVRPR